MRDYRLPFDPVPRAPRDGERDRNGDIVGSRCSEEEQYEFLAGRPLRRFSTETLKAARHAFRTIRGGYSSCPVFTHSGNVQLTDEYVPPYGPYQKYIGPDELKKEVLRRNVEQKRGKLKLKRG